MDTILELCIVVVPVIISGLFSFLIAKYTYNKNVPLDKFEISYNRVYYPLYRFIKNKSTKDIDDIINTTSFYLNRYDKYVDRSTMRAFNSLCGCNTNAKKKDALDNFKDNIYSKNSFLRRRLGYLEPSFSQMYTYSSKSDKATFRIIMEFCILYISLIFVSITKGNIEEFFLKVSYIFLTILIIECACKFVLFVFYKLKK